MNDIVFYIIIVVLLVVIGILLYLLPKAREKGANDIFALFLNGAYEERVKWFVTMNKVAKSGGSTFVGDSITNEYLLAEMLTGYNVHNRGIGGDTTEGVLKRLKESVYDLNPSKLFLLIGTNDIALTDSTDEQIVSNISLICDKSHTFNSELEINLISITNICDKEYPHVDLNTVNPRTNARINHINELLMVMAKAKNYNYLDFNQFLSDDTGSLRPEYTREGLHLSHKAYEVLTKEIKKYL